MQKRRMTMSECLRAEREKALADLDRLEAKPLAPDTERPEEAPRTHLDPRPQQRPTPLPDGVQRAANATVAAKGTSPEVIDEIMAAGQKRTEPLKPRKWSTEGFGRILSDEEGSA